MGELLRESVLMRGLISVGLIGTAIYLVIAGQIVPEWYQGMTIAVVSFFFGSAPTASLKAAAASAAREAILSSR